MEADSLTLTVRYNGGDIQVEGPKVGEAKKLIIDFVDFPPEREEELVLDATVKLINMGYDVERVS